MLDTIIGVLHAPFVQFIISSIGVITAIGFICRYLWLEITWINAKDTIRLQRKQIELIGKLRDENK